MLAFERRVVGALGAARTEATRSGVEAFVDGSLRAMPEAIRLGVLAESVLLGAYVRAQEATGRLSRDPGALRRELDRWETSPLGPVRQYVRMFRSLVLYSENEIADWEEQPASVTVEGAAT